MEKGKISIFGILGILVLEVAASGCTSSNTSNNTQSSQSPAPTTTSTPTFQPLTFSGTGQMATQSFSWPGGLMRVEMTHKGSSNFIIRLMDSSTVQEQELLVNEIGSFSGSRAFSVPAGTYILDVRADGQWTVKITNS